MGSRPFSLIPIFFCAVFKSTDSNPSTPGKVTFLLG
jgi:hypothetical protein